MGLFGSTQAAVEDFAVLHEFWKAGEGSEEDVREAYENALKRLEEAEFKSTLNQPEDELPAVLQINSGAGGTESQDWAEMLLRMYLRYAESQRWRTEMLSNAETDMGGTREEIGRAHV